MAKKKLDDEFSYNCKFCKKPFISTPITACNFWKDNSVISVEKGTLFYCECKFPRLNMKRLSGLKARLGEYEKRIWDKVNLRHPDSEEYSNEYKKANITSAVIADIRRLLE